MTTPLPQLEESVAEHRALIVDDEPLLARVLAIFVRETGLVVDIAPDLPEALAALERETYAVAIVDKNLPSGSGLDLLTKIREQLLATEVVIITGCPSDAARAEAERWNALAFLEKPFAMEVLVDVLLSAASGGRLPASLANAAGQGI